MTRHQVYLEGLKRHTGAQFLATITALRRDIRELFLDASFTSLSDMNKRELNLFVKQIVALQNEHFNAYTQSVLKDLRSFLAIDLEMNAIIMEKTQERNTRALAGLIGLTSIRGRDRLWATLANQPTPATGLTVQETLTAIVKGSGGALAALVMKGYANKNTMREVLDSIFGAQRTNFRDGWLLRSVAQMENVSSTLIQHIANGVSAAAASQYFSFYAWVSIIDGRTSNICLSRNGHVYRYGKGPLPPAHVRCRSKTVPVTREENIDVPTYKEWLRAQPSEFKKDIKANTTNSGMFNAISPLTLDQFKAKLKLILG